MARAYEIIGSITCDGCGKDAPLKKQKNGLAAYSCSWCGLQVTSHYEEASKKLKTRAGLSDEAPPVKVETPEPEPVIEQTKPAEKPKAKNIWGIEE